MAKTVKLNPDMKPKYKYNLNHQIGLLPKNVPIGKIVEHLLNSNITKDEFYRDRAIPFGSPKSISHDRLMVYAQVFECSIEDLTNQHIKAKSIREVMDNKPERSKNRTGLR
jgi:hypothetical protein